MQHKARLSAESEAGDGNGWETELLEGTEGRLKLLDVNFNGYLSLATFSSSGVDTK